MKYWLLILVALSFQVSVCLGAPVKKYTYLMTYFNGDDSSNLYIAGSTDGFKWEAIGNTTIAKVGEWKIFRDPSFIETPDSVVHLFWTAGSNSFGYARSRDLKTWTDVRAVPINRGVLSGSNVFTWAPEPFFDPVSKTYLILFSTATKKIGKGWNGDFRGYAIRTTNFETYSDPFRVVDKDLDLYEIDAALLYFKEKYYYFHKFEDTDLSTNVKEKDGIHYCWSLSLSGPWSTMSKDRLPGSLPNSEGPSPVAINDSTIIVYYDKTGKLNAALTNDIDSGIWTDITSQIIAPDNFRHGTVHRINRFQVR